MPEQPVERIPISFEASDASEALAWVGIGHETIQEVVEDINADGIGASIEEGTEGVEGSRGLGVGEVFISLASSALARLLFEIVSRLFNRASRPNSVTINVDGSEIRLQVSQSLRAIEQQLTLWVQSDLHSSRRITIRID